MIELPKSCVVDRFIAKKKFYERVNISKVVKEQFVKYLNRITWKYKISQDTLNINKTKEVEEIQVIELLLEEKFDTKDIIKIITKCIPYPILFYIKYENEFQYAIRYNDEIFYSEWNKDIDFSFSGLNLEMVYKDIVRKTNSIEDIANIDNEIQKRNQIKELEKEIKVLDNKIHKEKQFKKKVEYNHKRNELIAEVKRIKEEE